ncbi:MAG: hypothetical protein V4584_04935 [Verrucomicrobiota bacterium]
MILHQPFLRPKHGNTVEWWAVDVDRITLARCSVATNPKIFVDVVKPVDSTVAVSSRPFEFDPGETAVSVLTDCRKHFNHLKTCPATISEIDETDGEVPEYILLGSRSGIPQGVVHTTDPVFVAWFPSGLAAANPRDHLICYRSKVLLPPDGWEYWCTDARQEFQQLADEFLELIADEG